MNMSVYISCQNTLTTLGKVYGFRWSEICKVKTMNLLGKSTIFIAPESKLLRTQKVATYK